MTISELVNISQGQITVAFRDLSVKNEDDLTRMLQTLAPHLAHTLLEAKQRDAVAKKDWSVTGTVSTSSGGTTASATGTVSGKDAPNWSISASGATNVGPATVSGTVGTGSQGVSGSVSVTAHF